VQNDQLSTYKPEECKGHDVDDPPVGFYLLIRVDHLAKIKINLSIQLWFVFWEAYLEGFLLI
jgi:hypothetical protein